MLPLRGAHHKARTRGMILGGRFNQLPLEMSDAVKWKSSCLLRATVDCFMPNIQCPIHVRPCWCFVKTNRQCCCPAAARGNPAKIQQKKSTTSKVLLLVAFVIAKPTPTCDSPNTSRRFALGVNIPSPFTAVRAWRKQCLPGR